MQSVKDFLTQLAIIFTSSVSTISGGEFNQAGRSTAFGANSNLATFLVSAFNNAITNYPNSPHAFLIYLFFNKDFVFNPQVSGALQVIIPDVLGNLAITNVKFPENGYLYVYVCDESNMDVYFDNLQIIHYTNPFTEVNDYYPFGLLAKTSTSLGGTLQNYKYNGNELQKDLAFNVLDYGVKGDFQVRFCERIRLKYFFLLDSLSAGHMWRGIPAHTVRQSLFKKMFSIGIKIILYTIKIYILCAAESPYALAFTQRFRRA